MLRIEQKVVLNIIIGSDGAYSFFKAISISFSPSHLPLGISFDDCSGKSTATSQDTE
jgi:hypothetical protein